MLPADHRVTDAAAFRAVTRSGRRGSAATLVVHLVVGSGSTDPEPTRVGFVVGKAVGNSVVRHRVQRRLRHQMRERLGAVPGGSQIVVRALPSAAGASSVVLGADLSAALAAAGSAPQRPRSRARAAR